MEERNNMQSYYEDEIDFEKYSPPFGDGNGLS